MIGSFAVPTIVSVAIAALISNSPVPVAATAQTATFNAAASTTVEAEWVMSSTDTFGDMIERAVASQGSDVVGDALTVMSEAAAEGRDVGLQGLDALPAERAASLTEAAAESVHQQTELPAAVEELMLQPDSTAVGSQAFSSENTVMNALYAGAPPSTHTVATVAATAQIIQAGAGSGGLHWDYEGFIRRGVTTGGGGIQWTDRLNWTGTVDPGAVTSRLTFKVRRALDAGFFSDWGLESRIYKKDAFRDSVVAATGKQRIGDSRTDYMTSDPRTNDQQIRFESEFSARGRNGQIYSDQQKTTYAKCDAARVSNVCRW